MTEREQKQEGRRQDMGRGRAGLRILKIDGPGRAGPGRAGNSIECDKPGWAPAHEMWALHDPLRPAHEAADVF